jgi:hypothetical protein
MEAAIAASLGSRQPILLRLGGAGARLDRAGGFVDIAARKDTEPMEKPVEKPRGRRIVWLNVMTVLSAAVLIGAEVFGAAFAGGWAIAGLFDLGEVGGYVLQGLFFVLGLVVMVSFIRAARRVEPFTSA